MNNKAAAPAQNPLGSAPITSLMIKYSIPTIVSLLVTTIYNITDQVFIGHTVGMLGNGATNVVFPLTVLTTALTQLVGIGTAANFNMNMGAKNMEAAKKFAGTGMAMSILIGVIFGLCVLIFKMPLLHLCGATANNLPYASTYLGITAIGMPFLLFTNANAMLIRADGSPRYSMICTITGAILNIGLDALFMMALDLGMRGAAWATVISQVFSFALCLRYFFRFKAFPFHISLLRLKKPEVSRIAKLGTSNFLNQTIMMAVNIVMNNTLTYYGMLSIYGEDIPLAVVGVISKLNTILVSIAVGMSMGCQPIFSFNMGAKNYDRIIETYKKARRFAFTVGIIAFVIFQLFPRQITSIFGDGSELYFDFAEQYLRIFLAAVFLFGMQPLIVNYFTATGNVKKGIFLSVSRQGLCLLPPLIILPLIFGIDGVLYAGPVSDVAAFLLAIITMNRHMKELIKKESL
ncbi:MAG: MATE family efflux transporter [Clostridiales bacterium]|nr:MATE family efflux transporter [Clostridiales bacterium]